jgi:hypothetical protein
MELNNKDKFSFDIDFQWSILKFTVSDKNGYKALSLYKPEYFELNEQEVIADAIKKFFKRKNRIPQDIGLVEELRQLFKTKKYINNLTPDDKKNIIKKAKSLYKTPVKDSDTLLDGCIQFASYVELKRTVEEVDITDFNQYPIFSRKIQTAINTGIDIKKDKGLFVISGVRGRQARRKMMDTVFPTPFRQMNQSTNSRNGYPKGSVIVVMDKGKGGKTKALINIARGYLRMRKKILYIDLENGAYNLADRLDQSIIKKTKAEVLSGEFDETLQKIYRKYKRLGAEIVIERLPGLVTNANHIREIRDRYKNENGITFDLIIIDYVANMGSIDGDKDDQMRISKAYIDIKNLAEESDWESVWTGHHTVREAQKRRPTKYEPNDTAKCIDVHRHIDAMWGINQNPEEEKQKVVRLEVIDQRDGTSDARVFFWDDFPTQRMDEFSSVQVKDYSDKAFKKHEDKSKPKKATDLDE